MSLFILSFFLPSHSLPHSLTQRCCYVGTSWLCLLGFPQACVTETDAKPLRYSSPNPPPTPPFSSWVGYSEPGFEGQQHILEEGEYLDCRDWGGSEQLLSLQPVLSVSSSPAFNSRSRIAVIVPTSAAVGF